MCSPIRARNPAWKAVAQLDWRPFLALFTHHLYEYSASWLQVGGSAPFLMGTHVPTPYLAVSRRFLLFLVHSFSTHLRTISSRAGQQALRGVSVESVSWVKLERLSHTYFFPLSIITEGVVILVFPRVVVIVPGSGFFVFFPGVGRACGHLPRGSRVKHFASSSSSSSSSSMSAVVEPVLATRPGRGICLIPAIPHFDTRIARHYFYTFTNWRENGVGGSLFIDRDRSKKKHHFAWLRFVVLLFWFSSPSSILSTHSTQLNNSHHSSCFCLCLVLFFPFSLSMLVQFSKTIQERVMVGLSHDRPCLGWTTHDTIHHH